MRTKNIAMILTLALTAGLCQTAAPSQAATPKLSAKKLTMKVGKTAALKVKKTSKKAKWSIVSGKKNIRLTAKKKTSVKVKAVKAGKAKISCKIGKKKLVCKVSVKSDIKENDVKIITDLMMGGDGTNTDGELGELHLSAICEAMNQMMGSAATALSSMLDKVIDISPPESSLFDLTEVKDGKEISPFLGGTFVKIAFRMQIDDLVDSSIMQLYPIDFARKLVETFINTQMGSLGESNDQAATQPESIPAPAAAPQNNAGQMNAGANNMTQMNMQQPDPMAMNHMNGMNQMGNMGMPQMNGMNQTGGMGMNQMPGMDMNSMNQMGMNGMPQMGMQQMGNMGMQQMNGMGMMNQMGMMGMPGQNVKNVIVQPAQLQRFYNDNTVMTRQ